MSQQDLHFIQLALRRLTDPTSQGYGERQLANLVEKADLCDTQAVEIERLRAIVEVAGQFYDVFAERGHCEKTKDVQDLLFDALDDLEKPPHPARDCVNEANELLAAKDQEIEWLRGELESRCQTSLDLASAKDAELETIWQQFNACVAVKEQHQAELAAAQAKLAEVARTVREWNGAGLASDLAREIEAVLADTCPPQTPEASVDLLSAAGELLRRIGDGEGGHSMRISAASIGRSIAEALSPAPARPG